MSSHEWAQTIAIVCIGVSLAGHTLIHIFENRSKRR